MQIYKLSVLVCYLSNVLFWHIDGNIFLNIDEYEYPRTNETLRQLHKQQWLKYYKCLKEMHADIGHEKIIYPTALIALEGTSITLKCQICISPMDMHMVNLIKWYFNSSSTNSTVKNIIQNTNHIFNSPDNQYIIMYNVKLEQAGIYWCEMGDTVGLIHYLHIDSEAEDLYSNITSHMPQVTSVKMMDYKLKIYTTWTLWSPCSVCNAVGIKLRYGYCTISLLETSVNRYFIEKTEAYERNQMHENTIQQTTKTNSSSEVQLRTALLLFKNKIPCKSSLVPKQIQLMPIIKNRSTEIMRRYCKKKCQKNMIFEVRDERGNILESANNSAGIYSMIQGIPPQPLPSITRNVIYEKYNKKIKLICPGNLNADIPIVWNIGNKSIIPSHIKLQSNGRIHINSQLHIVFESLKFEDSNTYSCWQNNEIVGIIKLNVIGELEIKLNHHIILIGAIFIISVVLIMLWRAFKGRTRYTMH
ncbi:Ig-like V-type domain-containing protein FAM187A [Polyergus mexicanus]|uniref:Ig-like V-type domain-containing protein FAM187A n=1 Tax=Polyergus mexicanus TaxID=615972 RepID=UPI0038B5D691